MSSSTGSAGRRALLAVAMMSAMTLTGCATDASNTPSGDIAGEWVLVSGSSGPRALTFDQSTTITLDIAAASSGGVAPCNSYGANVEGGAGAVLSSADDSSAGGAVRIAVTMQTLAACEDADLQELEERYLGILPQITLALIDDGYLVLTGGGSQLLFEPTAGLD